MSDVLTTDTLARVQIPIALTEPIVEQAFLFEFSATGGFAPAYYLGLFIDHSGIVYTYAHFPPHFEDPTNGVYAEPFLNVKTASNRRYLQTVSPGILRNMWGLLPSAAVGHLSEPTNRLNDAGTMQYKGFIRENQTSDYTVILLRQDGDWEITNSAPEAVVLADWLSGFAGKALSSGF